MTLNQKLKQIAAGLGLVAILLVPSIGLAQPSLENLKTTDVIPSQNQVFAPGSGIERVGTLFSSPQTLVATIFRVVIIVAGLIFLLMLLFGGITYLTGAGNDDQTGKAKKMMVDAIVGLIIVLAAWAIGTYVLRTLGYTIAGESTSTTTTSQPTSTPSTGNSPTPTSTPGLTRTRIRQELRIKTTQLDTDPGAQQARSNFYTDCRTPADKTKEAGDVVATFSGDHSVFNCYRKLTSTTPSTTPTVSTGAAQGSINTSNNRIRIRPELVMTTSGLNTNANIRKAYDDFHTDCQNPEPNSSKKQGEVVQTLSSDGTKTYLNCYEISASTQPLIIK